MKKQIKQAISFLMAVCLLAGNSYVDIGASAVTMTDWVEVSEEDTTTEIQEKETKQGRNLLNITLKDSVITNLDMNSTGGSTCYIKEKGTF